MTDAELIVVIRNIRKLIVTLDSIGFPIQDLSNDKDIINLIPKDMSKRIVEITSMIHSMTQKIEHSKRYRNAIYKLCSITEKKTFILDGGIKNGGEHTR